MKKTVVKSEWSYLGGVATMKTLEAKTTDVIIIQVNYWRGGGRRYSLARSFVAGKFSDLQELWKKNPRGGANKSVALSVHNVKTVRGALSFINEWCRIDRRVREDRVNAVDAALTTLRNKI